MMTGIKRTAAVALLVLAVGSSAVAAEKKQEAGIETAKAAFLTVAKGIFKRDFPLDSFTETAAAGVYQAVSGQNVAYYLAGPKYLFIGNMVSPDGRNLTQEVRDAAAAKKFQQVPLAKALKVGNGKKVVVEITDPVCPYCQRAAAYLDGRSDLTRYVFLAPLAHPAAKDEVEHILAAKDPQAAFLKAMHGELDSADAAAPVTDAARTSAKEQLEIAKSLGVSGTPTFYIDGKVIVGADIPALERLLGPATK